MVTGRLGSGLRRLFDAVTHPSRFVAAPGRSARSDLQSGLRQTLSLVTVLVVNLALYAGPLTLAGYGTTSVGPAPSWFRSPATAVLGDPAAAWQLANGFAQNSVFLLGLSTVTLVTYHGTLVVTFTSRGFLLTLHTVVYSVSAYLAGIFTVLVYLSEQPGLETARQLVVEIQVRFIGLFYDAFGIPASERVFQSSGTLSTADLGSQETFVLAVLALLALYFAYSLYLGTRLNHGAGYLRAVVSVFGVALAPAVYVGVLLLYSTGGSPL